MKLTSKTLKSNKVQHPILKAPLVEKSLLLPLLKIKKYESLPSVIVKSLPEESF